MYFIHQRITWILTCFGRCDFQNWELKDCPVAWARLLNGREKKPTVVSEVFADGELLIWAFGFGAHLSMNDINVLD